MRADNLDQLTEPDGVDDLWAPAFRRCEVDYEKIAWMTELSDEVVQEEVQRLQDLRLIYPDGTITRIAAQIVRSHISAHIGKPKKSARR